MTIKYEQRQRKQSVNLIAANILINLTICIRKYLINCDKNYLSVVLGASDI